jgi:hypothetical protein
MIVNLVQFYQKLEEFIKKYLNELAQRIVTFVGLDYCIFIHSFIEYFLWLAGKELFFVIYCSRGFFLCAVYMLPWLTKLSKGIDYATVSMIIGEHFMRLMIS